MQSFLQPLADAGMFGPPGEPGAFQVVCDERLNGPDEVAAGRINLLVSLRAARPGTYWSFVVSHAREGGRVRSVRSVVLPSTARPSMDAEEVANAAAEAQRQRTVAQALYGHYREPRPPAPSLVVRNSTPITTPAGSLDPETIARIHRELGGGLQRF